MQGVGFRPWAVRQALQLGLGGFAGNDRTGLVIEIEGEQQALEAFGRRLRSAPPPLAIVVDVEVVTIEPTGSPGFAIKASAPGEGPAVAVPADVATCDACFAEIRDPAARRFRYPFTNCTNCGPRYTIIRSLPYDRAATTMAGFPLCGDCAREYADPADRRFHAEPIACPACGPTLTWEGHGQQGEAALTEAVACLVGGGVVAVKGVGGYHLAVLGDDDDAVGRLRLRKARDDKPFAVMAASLADAEDLVVLDADARAALVSSRRPIVIAPRRRGVAIAGGVAPGLPDLGVLLPYSPLHHLLLEGVGHPLVLTSGNRAQEPIACDVVGSRRQLAGLADGFLHHDRPIEVRCDDAIIRAVGGRVQVVRRSRGFAPEPIRLPVKGSTKVLAVGAELKNTVAIAAGGTAVTSHHLGDIEHPAAYAAFEQAIVQLQALTGVEPEIVAHDLHPEYLSTKWAVDSDRPTIGVQHHHAHVASCLVDHGRSAPVLGIAFDGLGFGSDGTLWGGELLVADLHGFRRVGHLRPVPLPGGAAAIHEPWRMALAWVALAVGQEAAEALGPSLDHRWQAVLSLAASPTTQHTTSGGRLFDAVAALAGLRHTTTYEGQAAAELEAAARSVLDDRHGRQAQADWVGDPPLSSAWVLDPSPLVADALAGRLAGQPAGAIAAAFHEGLGAGLSVAALALARREGVDAIALTGGVFQNAVLTSIVAEAVRAAGLEVLVHRHVPCNDGGISIGQAAIAVAIATSGRSVPGW